MSNYIIFKNHLPILSRIKNKFLTFIDSPEVSMILSKDNDNDKILTSIFVKTENIPYIFEALEKPICETLLNIGSYASHVLINLDSIVDDEQDLTFYLYNGHILNQDIKNIYPFNDPNIDSVSNHMTMYSMGFLKNKNDNSLIYKYYYINVLTNSIRNFRFDSNGVFLNYRDEIHTSIHNTEEKKQILQSWGITFDYQEFYDMYNVVLGKRIQDNQTYLSIIN